MAIPHPLAVRDGIRIKYMFYVYILLLSNDQLYTGLTSNLQRRIREHKRGRSPFTKNRLPVKLIYFEVFINKADAEKRERYFKTSKGKYTLRAMLKNTLLTK
jgi:putative endonuclease